MRKINNNGYKIAKTILKRLNAHTSAFKITLKGKKKNLWTTFS